MLAYVNVSINARSLREAIDAIKNGCTHLEFTHNMKLSDNAVREIQIELSLLNEEISQVPTTIRYLKVYEDLVEKKNNTSARLLKLQNEAICLFESITDVAVLRSLHLEYKSLGDDAIESLSKSLSKLNALDKLDLSANYITSIGADTLGYELKNHSLRELYLDSNRLQNSGIHRLGLALQGNKNLMVMSLRNNGIGPDLPAGLILLLTSVEVEQAAKEELPIPSCRLQAVRLDRNSIETIPIRLGACVNLLQLTLEGNPIQSPSPKVTHEQCLSSRDILTLSLAIVKLTAGGWPQMFRILRAELAEEESRRKQQVQCVCNIALKHVNYIPRAVNAAGRAAA